MSATKGFANISTDNPLSVYKYTGRHCPDDSLNISHGSVTIQRSLWSVEGNVTCDDDYFLLQTVITCMDDGNWTSITAQCEKSVWRYPETKINASQVTLAIPGTVVEGWSMCVEGVPTSNNRIDIQIFQGYNINRTVLTSWRFEGYLQVTDSVSGKYGASTNVTNPPFPLVVGTPFFYRLTVNTSTTVHIYMNNVFFYQHVLRYPLSSFSHMNVFGSSVNVTKVEAWCRG
ncbi:uncharacterized protein LOC112573658 [Pomacea canaliculata]|uniref:uncharacterized protein LOC112573658 n=1 Tax=Pomacea canaliculata TaxID=400727 RepID=UPI000D7269E0|nr:uncharacterized protein LOC112573658 [Pomacea canaliculata]